MALNLRHKAWKKTGREMEVLDESDRPTGKIVWTGKVGEQCVHDGIDYQPYIWDSDTNEIRYSANDMRIGLESGAQTIKKAGSILCRSMKLFIQREISPGVWQTEPHGLPTRQVRHNKRYVNGQLTDEEGYALGWLEFPDAAYDLQIGLQAGRGKNATLGFRFRAPISATVRMQLVKDGIAKIEGAEAFKLLYAGKFKGREERVVGIQYKDFSWRWTWKEAANRDVAVEDSIDHPGKLKVTITIGPINYQANTWAEVLPDTWGYTEVNTDLFENEGYSLYSDTDLYVGCYENGGEYFPLHAGLTWQNVDAEGTVSQSYIKIYDASTYGSGANDASLKAVDTTAVPAWSYPSIVPSNITTHAPSVTWNESGTGTRTSPDIKSLIQARVDDDHVSGTSELTIVWLSNEDALDSFVQFDATETGTGANLYVVYTPVVEISYVANVLGTSSTPDVPIEISRALTGDILGTSSLALIPIEISRAFSTDVLAASSTSVATATLTRRLSADVLAASSMYSGSDLVVNGTFDADTDWAKGDANWTISAGTANHAAGAAGWLMQNKAYLSNRTYEITFTISGRTAGYVNLRLGLNNSTNYDADGTHTVYLPNLTGIDTATLSFKPSSAFDGSLDNVSARGLVPIEISRALTGDILGTSSLALIPIEISRAFSTDVLAASSTSVATATLTRRLSADILGASATSDDVTASVAEIISYVTSILGASYTADFVPIQTSRLLTGDILAASSTSDDTVASLARAIVANISGTSEASDDVAVVLAGVISLVVSMLAVSSTADDVPIAISRSWTGNILGASLTPGTAISFSRALIADILGGSWTSDDTLMHLSGLGVIKDTTIESLTVQRSIQSSTVVRRLLSLTVNRTILAGR